MTPFTCILIGEESLLIQCAKVVLGRGHEIAAVASRNPDVLGWAKGAGIAVLEPGKGLETRISTDFDWLLSISNLSVLPQALLDRARKGAVNFHDGPLPRYAGLNAPLWARLNGESRHGITWHLIGGGIDEGDILSQVYFNIAEDDTAFSLNARCYAAAIESFPGVVAVLEGSAVARSPQDLSQRSLCRRDDRPAAAARLDFTKGADDLVRLVRALDHGGYWNPLALPKLASAAGVFAVTRAERAEGRGRPGEVLEVGASLLVACGDGAVLLSDLTCLGGMPVAASAVAKAGEDLPGVDEALTQAMARVTKGEAHWRRALADFAPAGITANAGGSGFASRALVISAERAVAILAAYAPGDWALIAPHTKDAHDSAPEYVARWVPMAVRGDTLGELAQNIRAGIGASTKYASYARDLIGRDPALSPLVQPALALSLVGEHLAGSALCVIVDGPQAILSADLSRVDAATLDLFTSRVAHLAGAAQDAPLAALDRLAFIAGVGVASFSWQLCLAGLGALAQRRLSPSIQVWVSALGNGVVLALGIRMFWPA